MKSSFAVTMWSLLVSQGMAHMAMTYPPPLRSKENPFSTSANIDYSITSPLSASGSDFPCKGTLNLLGTAAAQSVATWQAGQQYNMTIAGGANHNGGSCQAALSYDKGQTFTVIHSYIGNCPPAGTSSFKFTVPADAPASSDALFAWTWFNNVGNRELYVPQSSPRAILSLADPSQLHELRRRDRHRWQQRCLEQRHFLVQQPPQDLRGQHRQWLQHC